MSDPTTSNRPNHRERTVPSISDAPAGAVGIGSPSRTVLSKWSMVVAAGLACGFSVPAMAQNALGAGDVLDGNLSVDGRRNQAAPRIENQIRAADAIVTGNAPDGRSFRGQVDYGAAGDFRAELGSDALFSFRRDSYFSGLAGRGIRGTEALQYQNALTVSGDPSAGLLGGLVLQRDFSGTTGFDRAFGEVVPGSDLGDSAFQAAQAGRLATPGELESFSPGDISAYQRSLNDQGAVLWSTRATSSYVTMRSLQPAFLANLDTGGGEQVGITASPLRGIRAEVVVDAVLPDIGGADAIQNRSTDELFRRETARDGRANTGRRIDMQANRPADARAPGADIAPSYLDLIERYRTVRAPEPAGPSPEEAGRPESGAPERGEPGGEPAAGGTPEIPPTTRAVPRPATPAVSPGGTAIDGGGAPQWYERVLGLRYRALRALSGQTAAAPGARPAGIADTAERRTRIDPETITLIRQVGGSMASFGTDQMESDSLYTSHIRTAERLLVAERYFDAESRFTIALSLRTGDPIAEIGRVHAQLGAGMFRSAGDNLRRFLAIHPEMASVRYTGALQPSGDRLAQAIDRFGEILDTPPFGSPDDASFASPPAARLAAGDPAPSPAPGTPADASDPEEPIVTNARARATALLLAYLAYQLDDAPTMNRGLDALHSLSERAIETGDAAAEGDLLLARLLRGVWTEDGN